MKLLILPWMGLVALGSSVPVCGQPSARTHEWPIAEDVLRTGKIVNIEELGRGANKPLKLTLEKEGRTVSGLWKPIKRGPREETWESYQAEIAAYELDKMIGLYMVPPTLEKEIRGVKGSLQLWMEGCRLFRDAKAESPGGAAWDRTMSRMKLFDNLISNGARSEKDFMVDPEWNVLLIDHSQAFLSTTALDSRPDQLPELFDRRLMDRLRSLQADMLSMRFGRLLLDPQVRAILARRDALLTLMEKAVAEKGESAVLF